MSLRGSAVLLFFTLAACGKTGRTAEPAHATPPRAWVADVQVSSAEAAPVEMVPGSWEPGDGEGKWTRREGPSGPPLVVRGVVQPTHTDSNMGMCPQMLGARHGTTPLALHVDGEPRTLYVFAKARGPIGLAASSGAERCATAGANAWARLVVPDAVDDVTIAIADVDFAGERRGQTSPFVVVVSDEDREPTSEPAARAEAAATDVVVRWAIEPRACATAIEMFSCANATLELADGVGKVKKRVPLKGGLVGQLGCWPQGTGVHCGGPSGSTTFTLESAADGSGNVEVRATSESDGYCPPPADCASRETRTTFTLPRGARLVADPAGTWPPMQRLPTSP